MKKVSLLMAVLMLVCVSFSAMAEPNNSVAPNPIVSVEQGQLMGYMNEGTYAFLGVPYATAGRFEMPVKPAAWEGVRKAQSFGEIAPIPDQTTVGYDEFVWPHRYWPQNENCQFVNIWTQSVDTTANKPVIVFFHGGGHTNGSSIESVAYEGKNLSEFGDVVVVTLNHRLNVLGYLDLSAYGDAYKSSGDLGVADLVAALQWIHDNIAQFGGNPDNVTIFGQSGGGGKVESVLHAPTAAGLVHRAAILSSGGASLSNRPQTDTRILAAFVLDELGLTPETIDEIKAVPYRTLIDAANRAIARAKIANPKGNYGWGPVADEEFVTLDYCEWTADVPMIIGSVFSESDRNTLRVGDGRKNEWTPEETAENLKVRFGDDADAALAEFKKIFPNKIDADLFFYTNRTRVTPATLARMASSNAPVYNYMFSYEAPVNGGVSAFHCVDLIYLFHNVDIPIVKIATGGMPEAYNLQDVMAKAFVSFATTGNPSQEGLEWPAWSPEGMETMVFDADSAVVKYDDAALLKLMAGR